MAEYIYEANIYKDTTGVIGVDVTQNTADKTDFETNHKSGCLQVDAITILQTSYRLDKTYTQFDALITGDITWADVKFIDDGKTYKLYLITNAAL